MRYEFKSKKLLRSSMVYAIAFGVPFMPEDPLSVLGWEGAASLSEKYYSGGLSSIIC